MEALKPGLKNSFVMIAIFCVLLIIGMNAGLYYGMEWFLQNFSKATTEQTAAQNLSRFVLQIEFAAQHFYKLILPITTGSILLIGLIMWLILKSTLVNSFKQMPGNKEKNLVSEKRKKDFVDQKIEQDRKRRLFLHSLSILQRDGRLLDFFNEDLSLYGDEQIGAAVRSIQEDCKRAVKKYIDPVPVLQGNEGDKMIIEPGFDIDAIKLIGNVSGQPPFEGVLRHRGWKAGKSEIPKLSDVQDASIIIPAEVEMQ